MKTIISKLIKKEEISDEDIVKALHDICDREHASCNDDCPVYEKLQDYRLCDCFKDGKAMLKFLRKANL